VDARRSCTPGFPKENYSKKPDMMPSTVAARFNNEPKIFGKQAILSHTPY